MCGICGVLHLGSGIQAAGGDIEAMSNMLVHRGPDDYGTRVSGPVKLGFRRLSIVDVAGGRQPMCNEDGTVWIVFNGEIYNHRELRPVLEQRGHRYATNSDTETILHSYEEYGEDCVHHLRGMFAFAIWDQPRQKLFCARDRLGIKPFYYSVARNHFVFASEIKSLFEVPSIEPKLNKACLPEFFAFGYLSSEETMFEGVRKLLPGHRLVIYAGRGEPEPSVSQYWDVDPSSRAELSKESEYVAKFDELFTEAVRIHLRSDVPLGVFLSGGLDSSSIATVAAALQKEPIETFSVGYAESQFSELTYSRQMAKHIGARHHEVIVGADDFFDSLPALIWHEDEPLVWPSSVALYYVAQLARDKVKVVLTGEGADELLGGYLKYRVTLWNLRGGRLYRKYAPESLQNLVRRCLDSNLVPDWWQRKLRHSFLYHPEVFEKIYFDNFYCAFPQEQHRQMFTRDLAEEAAESSAYANSMSFFRPQENQGDLLNRLLYLDMKTYLVELLMKQDQMSMAASIESRVPFLDHKLVEFVSRVPARYKARLSSGKYLLRRAMAGRLPAEVLTRSKKGFPTPIRPWLRTQLLEKLRAKLTDGRLAARNLIRADYVERLLSAHQSGSSAATEGCWRLLNFELWCRIFLDHDSSLLPEFTTETQRAKPQLKQNITTGVLRHGVSTEKSLG